MNLWIHKFNKGHSLTSGLILRCTLLPYSNHLQCFRYISFLKTEGYSQHINSLLNNIISVAFLLYDGLFILSHATAVFKWSSCCVFRYGCNSLVTTMIIFPHSVNQHCCLSHSQYRLPELWMLKMKGAQFIQANVKNRHKN